MTSSTTPLKSAFDHVVSRVADAAKTAILTVSADLPESTIKSIIEEYAIKSGLASRDQEEPADEQAFEIKTDGKYLDTTGAVVHIAGIANVGDRRTILFTTMTGDLFTASGESVVVGVPSLVDYYQEKEVEPEGTSIYVENGMITDDRILFYEHDHYYLSNFSAFKVQYRRHTFDTSEAAYQWAKFDWSSDTYEVNERLNNIRLDIITAPSAHAAFKLARSYDALKNPKWEEVKVGRMIEILKCKVQQHSYVRDKLLSTGTRELIEVSHRDSTWGWGPYKDGKNLLGACWVNVRAWLRETQS